MTDDPWGTSLDVCGICGITIGYGIRALHLGVCEDCRDHEAGEGTVRPATIPIIPKQKRGENTE